MLRTAPNLPLRGSGPTLLRKYGPYTSERAFRHL